MPPSGRGPIPFRCTEANGEDLVSAIAVLRVFEDAARIVRRAVREAYG